MARFVFAQKVIQVFEIESDAPRGDVITSVRNGEVDWREFKSLTLETEGLPYFVGVKNEF